MDENQIKEDRDKLVKVKKNKSMPIIIAVIAVVILAVVLVIVLTVNGKSSKVDRHFKTAARYMDELDYENAVAEYKAIIEIDSKNVEAYLGLAEAYVALDKVDRAIAALEEGYGETEAEEIKELLEELKERQEAGAAGTDDDEQKEGADSSDGDDIEEEDSTTDPSIASIKNSSVGDIISFGNDTYSNEWRVLDKDGDKLLLINENAVALKEYNAEWTEVTWETCTLRSWLNNEYFDTAFSEEERAAIEYTYVVNNDNPENGIEGGADTNDYIFLLSLDEVNQYFTSDDDRVCTYTGAWTDIKGENGNAGEVYVCENERCWWWLRSPGSTTGKYAACVDIDGNVLYHGDSIIISRVYVFTGGAARPAFWLDASKL